MGKPTTKPLPGPKGKSDMKNEQFEIKKNGRKRYITVIDSFKHHYTGETMRTVRIEPSCENEELPTAYTRILNEDEFNDYLKLKIERPVGFAFFKNGTKKEITSFRKSNNSEELFTFWIDDTIYRFDIRVEEGDTNWIQRPTFEYRNHEFGCWVKADVDHVEIYEE